MKIIKINFFLLFMLWIIKQLKIYAITRLMINEKIKEEKFIKGIAIMLLLIIGKNQKNIAKGMVNKILFLFRDNKSLSIILYYLAC